MQVIPSACDRCEDNVYMVTNACRGCVAHPCMEVCPKGAISRVNGRAVIDQDKCIKCGKCKAICPYEAIVKKERPCACLLYTSIYCHIHRCPMQQTFLSGLYEAFLFLKEQLHFQKALIYNMLLQVQMHFLSLHPVQYLKSQ